MKAVTKCETLTQCCCNLDACHRRWPALSQQWANWSCLLGTTFPANIRGLTNAKLLLANPLRRWPSINPTLPDIWWLLGSICNSLPPLVCFRRAPLPENTTLCCLNADAPSATLSQHWFNVSYWLGYRSRHAPLSCHGNSCYSFSCYLRWEGSCHVADDVTFTMLYHK